MKTLTVKEAIEQGYKYCGYDGLEYQTLNDIEDLSEDDFGDEGIVLFAKKPYFRNIQAVTIREMIEDYMYNSDDTVDDTDFMDGVLTDEDCKYLADKVNNTLKNRPYYRLTDIKLVP